MLEFFVCVYVCLIWSIIHVWDVVEKVLKCYEIVEMFKRAMFASCFEKILVKKYSFVFNETFNKKFNLIFFLIKTSMNFFFRFFFVKPCFKIYL